MKKIICCLLAVIAVMLLATGCNNNQGIVTGDTTGTVTPANTESVSFDISVKEINKHGNVILNTTMGFLKDMNIEPGDVITITISDREYDIPVGTSYSDVDSGCMICRFDIEEQKVILAVNGGSFAEITEMAEKQNDADTSGITWNVKTDKVSFQLKEKEGYMDEYTLRNLERTNKRSDYAILSDDDFANCRAVSTTGIRANILFRGTTPLDPKMGRNEYAMSFIELNKIRSILNLTDSYEEMTGFDVYPGSYYSTCAILNPEMGYSFVSDEFASKVKDCVLFINENDGPYYIHCKEGKDRTGVLCAVLECFCGASYDEAKSDYIKTYENFYHVEKWSDAYYIIIRTNFDKVLSELFGIKDIASADLKKAAENYLLSCKLTENDLSSLAAKIGK